MRLGIVIDRQKQDAANKFFDDLNPENAGNSLPNVELVDSEGNVVADYCDYVPTELESQRAIAKENGKRGRELFDALEHAFNGLARVYEIVEEPTEEKQVSSTQEILEAEGLSIKETEL